MTATTTEAAPKVQAANRFYVWMMVVCAAIAVLGFMPTYFLPLSRGAFQSAPLTHIHGALFFTWTLFVIYQTSLVSSGKTAQHREVGMVGIAIVTAMVFFGIAMALHAGMQALGTPFLPKARAFIIVPIFGILTFATLFVIAIRNVRQPEWHKRLILVATASILDAPIARWFLTFLAPPPPPGVPAIPTVEQALAPALCADLVIVAAIIYDWRTRGKPHPAYLIGGGAVLIQQLLRLPVSETVAWASIGDWLLAIAR